MAALSKRVSLVSMQMTWGISAYKKMRPTFSLWQLATKTNYRFVGLSTSYYLGVSVSCYSTAKSTVSLFFSFSSCSFFCSSYSFCFSFSFRFLSYALTVDSILSRCFAKKNSEVPNSFSKIRTSPLFFYFLASIMATIYIKSIKILIFNLNEL